MGAFSPNRKTEAGSTNKTASMWHQNKRKIQNVIKKVNNRELSR